MRTNNSARYPLVILIAALFIQACATPPQPKPLTIKEQVKLDISRARDWIVPFEKGVKIKKEIEVEVYLRHLAEHLSATTPALVLSPVGVFIIGDTNARWQNFSIPGNRLYISLGFLSKIESESELAAVLALELAHIVNRDALLRMEVKPGDFGKPEFFGPSGLFTYTEDELLKAIETGNEILYRAGEDPRGVVALLKRYSQNEAHSPFEVTSLPKLIDKARDANAQYPPLLNPVVRTKAFLEMQKRVRNL